ncbi:MAG: CCA tRNA nucleotidyltransferase [Methanomassiliicoccales archaeon]|nr:CCA tRNA nucleotidyltransferase [Methanomassiliicoccales archaeon]
MSLEEELIRQLRPSTEVEERLDKAISELVRLTEVSISRTGSPLEIILVGSVAKGTFVGTPDIDLFIQFPVDVERRELERLGLRIGQEVLGGERRYAEHPYTHGTFQGFEVDLVPCYKVADAGQLRSAVDRTPFHTHYVLERLIEGQRDQVRLLKKFMKGVGVYGAEARVHGFSGYLSELLILTFKDFSGVVKAALDWRPGLILDVDGAANGGGNSPLTFADPVDAKRNVSSALSLDSFCLFIHACREYYASPDVRFFFPREREPWPMPEVERTFTARGTHPLVVVLNRPDLVDDNLFPQLQRSALGLRKLLEAHEFKVMDHSYAAGKDVRVAFELERDALPVGRLHQGPPAWTANADEFLAKWRENGLSQPFLSEGRWVVYVQREFCDPAALIEQKGSDAALGNDFRSLDGMRCCSGPKVYRTGNLPVLSKIIDKRENWRV